MKLITKLQEWLGKSWVDNFKEALKNDTEKDLILIKKAVEEELTRRKESK